MTTDEVLRGAILAELLALVLMFCAIVGHALWTARTDRGLQTRMRSGRPLLLASLERSIDDVVLDGLRRLGRDTQIRLFAELAPSLEGANRVVLRELASRLGIEAHAAARCRSRWWWRRLDATRLLTLVDGGEEIMPTLIHDPHPLVRMQVAQWATLHPAPATLVTLVELLGDQQRIARFAVQDTLLRIGRPAVLVLMQSLGTMTPLAVTSGLLVASRLGDPELLPLGLAFTDHPDVTVRASAADVLGAIGGDDAVQVLRRLLEDPATEVRQSATRGLGRLEHWPSAAALMPLLSDPTWSVRRESALALTAMGPPGSLILRTALHGSDRFAADIAAQALGTQLELS